jgi:antitoxin CptB
MAAGEQAIEARRRRAVFRATHRGTKEMDWVLGRFAESEVASMAEADLAAFEQFLTLPDPEIEQWVVHGATPRPEGTAGAIVEWLRRFHGMEG